MFHGQIWLPGKEKGYGRTDIAPSRYRTNMSVKREGGSSSNGGPRFGAVRLGRETPRKKGTRSKGNIGRRNRKTRPT